MHNYTQDHNWIYKAWEKTVEMDVLCSPPTLSCRAQGYSLALASVNVVHLNSLSDESSGWESACPGGLERAKNKNRDLKCWLYQEAYTFRSLIFFFQPLLPNIGNFYLRPPGLPSLHRLYSPIEGRKRHETKSAYFHGQLQPEQDVFILTSLLLRCAAECLWYMTGKQALFPWQAVLSCNMATSLLYKSA